jgi:CheY-like chemotaxis protein
MSKILVVEDNIIIRMQIYKMLDFEGYEVLEAANGLDCLELAKTHKPDLILCDISMPKLDGFGVLEGIKRDPRLSDIPIIFLTADTTEDTVKRARELGVNDFITKPFIFIDLKGSIEKQLSFLGIINNIKD